MSRTDKDRPDWVKLNDPYLDPDMKGKIYEEHNHHLIGKHHYVHRYFTVHDADDVRTGSSRRLVYEGYYLPTTCPAENNAPFPSRPREKTAPWNLHPCWRAFRYRWERDPVNYGIERADSRDSLLNMAREYNTYGDIEEA